MRSPRALLARSLVSLTLLTRALGDSALATALALPPATPGRPACGADAASMAPAPTAVFSRLSSASSRVAAAAVRRASSSAAAARLPQPQPWATGAFGSAASRRRPDTNTCAAMPPAAGVSSSAAAGPAAPSAIIDSAPPEGGAAAASGQLHTLETLPFDNLFTQELPADDTDVNRPRQVRVLEAARGLRRHSGGGTGAAGAGPQRTPPCHRPLPPGVELPLQLGVAHAHRHRAHHHCCLCGGGAPGGAGPAGGGAPRVCAGVQRWAGGGCVWDAPGRGAAVLPLAAMACLHGFVELCCEAPSLPPNRCASRQRAAAAEPQLRAVLWRAPIWPLGRCGRP